MKVYVDTSVVLRVVFREPNALGSWGRWDEACSSRLWRTEALRLVDRRRLTGTLNDEEVAESREKIDLIHAALLIIPVTEAILERAGDAFPTTLKTLDAIHLSSALAARLSRGIDCVLTHDIQLATAARSLGFVVDGV